LPEKILDFTAIKITAIKRKKVIKIKLRREDVCNILNN